ncbi:hypothetical protein PLICRDRAFT_35363 [Plicaturopsis crispa FD-325 SS-3]|nr:hypothetical protein PLICRDRAFT_35363 [Plicaturopsis crispa FD-325 SS-3]
MQYPAVWVLIELHNPIHSKRKNNNHHSTQPPLNHHHSPNHLHKMLSMIASRVPSILLFGTLEGVLGYTIWSQTRTPSTIKGPIPSHIPHASFYFGRRHMH